MDYSVIESSLGNQPIGHTVYSYRRCRSTMDVVHSLAWTHPGGTLVFAEAQTEGRGRHQRKWVDVGGCSIAVSILLRDRLWDGGGNGIPLLSGLAVLEAIEETHPELRDLTLDWPNDVVHAPANSRPRKVAGVLLEAGRDPQGSPYAVLGIGINVNHTPGQLPPIPESRVPPTSLRMVAGCKVSRRRLAVSLCRRLSSRLHRERAEGVQARIWEPRLRTLGHRVSAKVPGTSDQLLVGAAERTDRDGSLLVRDADGLLHRLLAGEVTLSAV
ncbi:MAG: biotin--[acetyl-CoA-carboxylase] ligase [Caldilineaceae bacterium]|nr:biotin--[acetyl-CoA-carboxylase] ligase [Caldilineaceae bacterium]